MTLDHAALEAEAREHVAARKCGPDDWPAVVVQLLEERKQLVADLERTRDAAAKGLIAAVAVDLAAAPPKPAPTSLERAYDVLAAARKCRMPSWSDFVGKDPRGMVVVFTAGTWAHIQESGHQVGGWMTAISCLRMPDVILDNAGRARVVGERYIQYSAALGAYVVVPVKIIAQEEPIRGYGMIPVGSRVAVTAHTSAALPPGGLVWKKT